MRIGFIVNDVRTEEGQVHDSRLGQAAVNRGHEVWVIGVGDLAYDPDGHGPCPSDVRAQAAILEFRELHRRPAGQERGQAPDHRRRSGRADAAQRPVGRLPRTSLGGTVAAEFAGVAMRHGVIVLSDPNGLAKASSKMYFQLFPKRCDRAR